MSRGISVWRDLTSFCSFCDEANRGTRFTDSRVANWRSKPLKNNKINDVKGSPAGRQRKKIKADGGTVAEKRNAKNSAAVLLGTVSKIVFVNTEAKEKKKKVPFKTKSLARIPATSLLQKKPNFSWFETATTDLSNANCAKQKLVSNLKKLVFLKKLVPGSRKSFKKKEKKQPFNKTLNQTAVSG